MFLIDKILYKAFEDGKVVSGISAGAVCWFNECNSEAENGKFKTVECLNWFDEELADGISKKELKYNDVQYYVLDCKEGWFLKDDKLKNVEGKATKYLRARAFEHGYSVGAIVDKERLRIAYWVMVW